MKRIAVIAHTGKTFDGGLTRLRDLLAAEGHEEPLWYEISKSRRASKRTRDAVDAGATLLLVWGGDGTVQRVIDALPPREPPPIAVLPAGTANLFAANLRLPTDLAGAVQVALYGADRSLDVGRLNGERFGVMAGAGFDARMIADADHGQKARLGRLAYVWSGLRATRRDRQQMDVDVDGTSWFRGQASCVLLGNLGTIMGGITAFDDARPDDGRLDVGVVSARGPWQWARVITRMTVGRSDRSAFVDMTSGRRIDVRLRHKMPYELDGGDRPATRRLKARVEPTAITVRVPVEGAS
jgi:YegS/Rv2252/BmrU family lipid kinase